MEITMVAITITQQPQLCRRYGLKKETEKHTEVKDLTHPDPTFRDRRCLDERLVTIESPWERDLRDSRRPSELLEAVAEFRREEEQFGIYLRFSFDSRYIYCFQLKNNSDVEGHFAPFFLFPDPENRYIGWGVNTDITLYHINGDDSHKLESVRGRVASYGMIGLFVMPSRRDFTSDSLTFLSDFVTDELDFSCFGILEDAFKLGTQVLVGGEWSYGERPYELRYCSLGLTDDPCIKELTRLYSFSDGKVSFNRG